MNASRWRWVRVALLVGAAYCFVGRLFAVPTSHVHAGRLAAWAVSAGVFTAHIAHYRKLLEQHKLMAGGPVLDGAAGGMMIPVPGLTEQEIAAFAQADPAVAAGLLTFEVRPWLVGMSK